VDYLFEVADNAIAFVNNNLAVTLEALLQTILQIWPSWEKKLWTMKWMLWSMDIQPIC